MTTSTEPTWIGFDLAKPRPVEKPTLIKFGPNNYRYGDTSLCFVIGNPTPWHKFKMRFLPERWERECDEQIEKITGMKL